MHHPIAQSKAQHLILRVIHVHSGLGGPNVVSEQCKNSSFASVFPVTAETLIASNLEGFWFLKVSLLDTADMYVPFMQDMFQLCLFVEEPFCIPMHNIQLLLLWFLCSVISCSSSSPGYQTRCATSSSFGWTLSRHRARYRGVENH